MSEARGSTSFSGTSRHQSVLHEKWKVSYVRLDGTQPIEKMVAADGFEPPTKGL